MKVIIHYKNGKKFTINDITICYTQWLTETTLDCLYINTGCGKSGTYYSVLFLEEVDKKCGIVKYHFNPNTPMSIIPDVMTAQQRAKANRNGFMQMVNNTLSRLKDWKNYGQ